MIPMKEALSVTGYIRGVFAHRNEKAFSYLYS